VLIQAPVERKTQGRQVPAPGQTEAERKGGVKW